MSGPDDDFPLPLVLAMAGPALTDEERRWLKANRPTGIILFGRNIETTQQVQALVDELQSLFSPSPTLWIDQEGGRVQRLRAPFTRFPTAKRFGELFRENPAEGLKMAHLGGTLCGQELSSLGLGVNCAPVLDIGQDHADPVIGDRAFGHHPQEVIALAGAWLAGLTESGIMAVGKHFPGHGAALVDSHHALPVVHKTRQQLEQHELLPFRTLAPRLPALMTAHLIASGLDDRQPATWSAPTLKTLLRKEWDYQGLIVSDAVEMGALSGTLADRVFHSLLAGCDLVLCCTGRLEDHAEAAAGARRAMEQKDIREKRETLQRIETTLLPFRQPARHPLDTRPYRAARERLEALAETLFQADPTETG